MRLVQWQAAEFAVVRLSFPEDFDCLCHVYARSKWRTCAPSGVQAFQNILKSPKTLLISAPLGLRMVRRSRSPSSLGSSHDLFSQSDRLVRTRQDAANQSELRRSSAYDDVIINKSAPYITGTFIYAGTIYSKASRAPPVSLRASTTFSE